jgi:DNA polymerase-1
MEHIAILDGNSIVCRGFFAASKDKVSPDGARVGGVEAAISSMWKILGSEDIGDLTHAVVVFDGGGRNHRHEMFPAYKANRPPKPEGLMEQLVLSAIAAGYMGLTTIRIDGQEADDVIVTLADNAAKQGFKVSIVGYDKDFAQLVGSGITMFDPRADKWCEVGPADVFAKFGVRPDQMVDYQAIVGDTVDNIPGIKGVGAKTVAALLGEFGTLEGIYENLASITTKRNVRMLIAAGRDNAFLSKELVTLRRDIALPNMLYSDMEIGRVPPGQALIEFLESLGLMELRGRIARRIGYLEEAA